MGVSIIHLGVGKVGHEVARLITSLDNGLTYTGLFNQTAAEFNPLGLTDKQVLAFPAHNQKPTALTPEAAITSTEGPFILIDTTASAATLGLIKLALKHGGAVVTSNKKPLSSSQADYDELSRLAEGRLFYETTVGAGLPVIYTLSELLRTGDKVREIEGCFSGSLGFILTRLQQGSSFSEAVIEAKTQGFTEPDPRDDLSGTDVARKALILARCLGYKLNLEDISCVGLVPESSSGLTADEFMNSLASYNQAMAATVAMAKAKGQVLRYVANISNGSCRVGLQPVPLTSDIGGLAGPDNIVAFKTERYDQYPLVIKGPGAGIEVTAAGVYGDVLKARRRLTSSALSAEVLTENFEATHG
jgi:homoserine dehydrogenase